MARKPHEIVVSIINNAFTIVGLNSAVEVTAEKSDPRSLRKDIIHPVVDVVTRLKAQFDKRILKK